MITPQIPNNEKERLEALLSYSILDTLQEEEYDDITKIASTICDTKISLVSLIDDKRQWFKSHHGLDATETPRDIAFCAHAINNPETPFVINDSRKDERFFDNPLATGDPFVIFYAGIPLVDPNGLALGTLCVIDDQPKQLNQQQIDSLRSLAKQVVRSLELRKKKIELENSLKLIEEKNSDLIDFASIIAHDIKNPLTTISSASQVLEIEVEGNLNEDGRKVLDIIKNTTNKLNSIVDGILKFSKSSSYLMKVKEMIDLRRFFEELDIMIYRDDNVNVFYEVPEINFYSNKIALEQIFLNLINNAVKYNNKEKCIVDVKVRSEGSNMIFTVNDNGKGIPEDQIESIFDPFKTLQKADRFGNDSTGIGLTTVKRLVTGLNGDILIKSVIDEMTEFKITLPK